MTQAVDSENAKCVIISLREKGPNTRFFPVNLCIESEYRKIRTRKNSVNGVFSCSVYNQKKSIAQHEKRHDQAFKQQC